MGRLSIFSLIVASFGLASGVARAQLGSRTFLQIQDRTPEFQELKRFIEQNRGNISYWNEFSQALDQFENAWKAEPSPNDPLVAYFNELKDALRQFGTPQSGNICEDILKARMKYKFRTDPWFRRFVEIHPRLSACGAEVASGFLCDIFDKFSEIARIVRTAASYAWANKKVCLGPPLILGFVTAATSFLSGGVTTKVIKEIGIIMVGYAAGCGLAHAAVDIYAKIKACWEKMNIHQAVATVINFMMKKGCEFVGKWIFELVVAVISGGLTLPSTLSALLEILANAAEKTASGILHSLFGDKALDTAVGIVKSAARSSIECKF